MVRRAASCLALVAALVAACSAETGAKSERICTPDANVFCRCADRAEGTKKCKEDGQSFEACVPCDGSGSTGEGSGGTDGLGAGRYSEDDEESEGPPDRQPPYDAGNPTGPQNGPPDAGAGGGGGDAGSSTGTTKKDAGSGSTSGGGFPNTPHCKPLKNVAPKIELQKIADVPTAAGGGRLVDGLYVQSWVIEFTGDDGESGPSKHYSRETLEIMGDVGRYVIEDDDGTATTGGFRLTQESETDTKINVAYECPAAPPRDLKYDATDQTLIIYDPPFARVFVKQKETR
jgi:hypothetical protein